MMTRFLSTSTARSGRALIPDAHVFDPSFPYPESFSYSAARDTNGVLRPNAPGQRETYPQILEGGPSCL